MQDIGTMPMLGESLTIGIPVRVDSKERLIYRLWLSIFPPCNVVS